MREILFKAKRIDNGEWAEGYYAIAQDRKGIQQHNILLADNHFGYYKRYVINPETICQFTGLTDKNGNKIWENDLVDTDHYATKAHVVKYNYGSFYVGINGLLFHYNNVSEVIGNIFDNPELLKGCEE